MIDRDVALQDSAIKTMIGDGWIQLRLHVRGCVGWLCFATNGSYTLSGWQDVRLATLPEDAPRPSTCIQNGGDGTRGLAGVCMRVDANGGIWVQNRNNTQVTVNQATLITTLLYDD